MPEHDETPAPEPVEEEVAPETTSSTPNLRIPKSQRWGVEDKVVDGESK